MRYKEIIELNGEQLSKAHIASLNKEQRKAMIEPLFNKLREIGWMLPDFEPEKFYKSYNSLVDFLPDIDLMEIYNNSSVCSNICQYFCANEFFNATDRKGKKVKRTLKEVFENDGLLRKICFNRLGLDWYDDSPQETFNLSPKMCMFQALRSMRLVPQTSFFKADIAKCIYMKYSQENDIVYDFSSGFGGRALGALSCNRKYIGIDPLTTNSIQRMLNFLKIDKDRYQLNDGISEDYKGEENSIDFAFSSPPYYDQEYYSSDINQAYNKDEDYFYNVYWQKTLENIKYMLKKDKLLAINLGIKNDRMFKMAKEVFNEPVEIFRLRTVKSHLNKTGKSDATKYEPVYIFKNRG